jgi:hypothetical protein
MGVGFDEPSLNGDASWGFDKLSPNGTEFGERPPSIRSP